MNKIKSLNLSYVDVRFNEIKRIYLKSGYTNWESFVYDSIVKKEVKE